MVLQKNVITSFSQKIIQSLNGDASELIEEAKEKAKKVPQVWCNSVFEWKN